MNVASGSEEFRHRFTCPAPPPTPLAVPAHLIFSIDFQHPQSWFSLCHEVHAVFVDILFLSDDVELRKKVRCTSDRNCHDSSSCLHMEIYSGLAQQTCCTVRLESPRALIKGVASDVHEGLYRPKPI